ncbi:MAG: hypothetical protein VZQ55_08615 [Ruminococcus sp.]|nr:hypothetical protein [Ruminococcus sp.]
MKIPDVNMFYIIALAVCLCVSAIVGIVIYFAFVNRKEGYYRGGASEWIYNFLSFKKLLAGDILKILYIIFTLFNTFASICALVFNTGNNIWVSILIFLAEITLGNILIRVVYELILTRFIICENTTDINEKMTDLVYEEDDEDRTDDVRPSAHDLSSQYNKIRLNRNPDNVHTAEIDSRPAAREIYVYCPNCGQYVLRRMGVCKYCGEIL